MTKLVNINYTKLEIQDYLKSQKINLQKKKILFKARTRMINVNKNFGNSSPCSLCNLNEDDQSHLLECIFIKLESSIVQENKNKCEYQDIFGNDIVKMNNVAELLQQALRAREKLLAKTK